MARGGRKRSRPYTTASGDEDLEDNREQDEDTGQMAKRTRNTTIASYSHQRKNIGNGSNNDATEVAHLQQQVQLLQHRLKEAGSGRSDFSGDNDPESEEEPEFNPIQFTAASAITPMPTVTVPTPPQVNLDHINRRHNPAPTQTPRNAYMSSPMLDDESDDNSEGQVPQFPVLRGTVRRGTVPRQHEQIAQTPTPLSRATPAASVCPSSTTGTPYITPTPTAPLTSTPPVRQPNTAATCLLFSRNYVPSAGKPRASDYDSEGKAIILRAAAYYEAKIIGVGAFPDRAMQIGWANKAFKDGCRVAGKDYEPDDRVRTIIRNRGSRIRGDLLGPVKETVQVMYGFSLDTTKKAKRHNLQLYATLMDGMMFAYKARL
ncbi:hypothetical protein K435DRAFT_860317 [Dendrothele bispora CBS 962.96]|uniref:DUF6532 domain-containing protein n=1 Tax=Dendrothele bispora (strain CBS 962.96) TaxID=1314807 RepID=A0A4S8LYC4_DENBC|nr:hypothetical protein K435DRAFT_860317 [Dendrothele bispora CBS 962.96]